MKTQFADVKVEPGYYWYKDSFIIEVYHEGDEVMARSTMWAEPKDIDTLKPKHLSPKVLGAKELEDYRELKGKMATGTCAWFSHTWTKWDHHGKLKATGWPVQERECVACGKQEMRESNL